MGRIIRFNPDRHHRAQTLLPWYLTGQLQGEDLAQVESHLNDCAECRSELRLERRLQVAVADLPLEVEEGWAVLRERLGEPGAAAGRNGFWRRLAASGGVGWALAAQFVLVLMVVGLVLPISQPPRYHALGATRPAKVGDVIVIFRPEATAEDLTRSLRASGARLVDGPTEADAYLLDVPLAARPAALARLRADTTVTLAQPIDTAERP